LECEAGRELGIAGLQARGEGHGLLIVGVYVDDLVITGIDKLEVSRFKEEMKIFFSR
jgi:hypothetical protein